MKKELKDYLHLYLPVSVELNNGGSKVYNRTAVAVGNTDDEYRYVTLRMGSGAKSFTNSVFLSENRVKPILRPLPSMTQEDIKEWDENVTITSTPYCVEIDSKDNYGEFTEVYPDGSILSRSKDDGDIRPINGGLLFILLLKQGFDLFGLIEAGLAIDKTTL